MHLNLGGEGEVAGALNQQPYWAVAGIVSRTGARMTTMIVSGVDVIFCENASIPLPDGIAARIETNGVPIDVVTVWGQGVQTSEIRRLLRSGGEWFDNGVLAYRKP